MVSMTLLVEPDDLLAGWRPDTSRLMLPVASTPKLREKLAVRIQLPGKTAGATVLGSAVSVQRAGSRFRMELAVDGESLGAVRLLVSFARGELVQFPERPPRYLAKLPVRVRSNGAEIFMTTSCVSEGGCAVRWTGPLPRVGDPVRMRVGSGARTTEVLGQVAWISGVTAGIKFRDGGATWKSIFAEAERSGAPRS
jgi:hypothetical protein